MTEPFRVPGSPFRSARGAAVLPRVRRVPQAFRAVPRVFRGVFVLGCGAWLAACGVPEEGRSAGNPAAAPPGESSAAAAAPRGAAPSGPGTLVRRHPEERRLGDLRMLTEKGTNAEAYFSADGRRLIFQATRPGESECDQIYVMNVDGSGLRRVSTGEGRTTCGYFFPDGDRILYSSTHHRDAACPPPVDRSRGYVWPLHPYDLFTARPDGSDLRRLTDSPAYDAEATVSPDGEWIVFTSARDGDPEIYRMRPDGSQVRRLTREEGYDGGAFFSPDGSRIVYRAHHPTEQEDLADYRALLADGLVRPSVMEIFVMDADGSDKRQVTDNGAANFAPFFHPDGERIIFSSNLHAPGTRHFDLYLIRVDGSGLERVTYQEGFDGFPMFDGEGRRLVFASEREALRSGDINVFVAEWKEDLDAEE